MIREEAIRILYSVDNADEMDEEYAEAYNMAIKALEQEHCGDCISRSETYKKMLDLQCKKRERYLDIDDVHNVIYKMPSVSPMLKWIPVETALPEETVSVLVYAERNAYNDKGKFRKKVIDIGWQVDGIWHIDGCSGVVGIAWMPLPTPPNKSEIQTGAEGSE